MIRRGGQPDVPFLRALLRHAYHWRVNLGEADIPASRYVDRWGRMGDTVVVALDESRPVGAAWFRLYPPGSPGYGFVDAQTPELTIAVVPSHRGHGTGGELLEALLARAREDGFTRISLSAEPGQTGFYGQHGFRDLRREDGTVTMVADL